jgi:hypothetical protein
MKIYKIAQTTQTTQTTQAPNPAEVQEVMQAVTTLNTAIANINQSLRIIEQTNVAKLFQRDSLIKEIQAGNIAALDLGKIDTSLTAMSNIARVVPVINQALRVLQDNDAVARQLHVDIMNIQNVLITSLQKGDYSQFTQILQGFQTMLPAMSGTETTTNLGS